MHFFRVKPKPITVRACKVNATNEILSVQPQYTQSMEFYNATGVTVSVCNRDGTVVVLPSFNNGKHRGKFIVRKRHQHRDDVKLSVAGSVEDPDCEMEELFKAVATSKNSRQMGAAIVALNYEVQLLELEQKGGNVYMADLDIVVSLKVSESRSNHPYAQAANRLDLIRKDVTMNDFDNSCVTVKIIDNAGRVDRRFINIAGFVHRVDVIKSTTLDDGVYIARTKHTDNGEDVSKPTVSHGSLDDHSPDAEKPRFPILYRTFEEAQVEGDPSFYKRQLMEEKKLLQQKQEQELSAKKIELQNENLQRNLEVEEMKRDFNSKSLAQQEAILEAEKKLKDTEQRYKEESLRTKAAYEDESYRRKDTTEFIKMVPLLITGGLALGAVIKKFA